MTIKITPPPEARGKLKEVYDRITAEIGNVPPLLQVLSANPKILESYWQTFRGVILQSSLSRKENAMLTFECVKADGCGVCADITRADLIAAGLTKEEAATLEKDIREMKLDEKTKNKLIYSAQIAENPHAEEKLVSAFKGLGLSEEELLEIASIINANRALIGIMHSLGFHSV